MGDANEQMSGEEFQRIKRLSTEEFAKLPANVQQEFRGIDRFTLSSLEGIVVGGKSIEEFMKNDPSLEEDFCDAAPTPASGGQKDRFGTPLGHWHFQVHAVLSDKPKRMKQIMIEAGVEDTCYDHLNALVTRGLLSGSAAAGYALPSSRRPDAEAEGPAIDVDSTSDEFPYEADLRNYLSKHLSIIEPGLTLEGVEVPAGGRFIDILATSSSGEFVVIELKVSKGYDRVVGQLMRYMAWIQLNRAAPGKKARGIIIARSISEDLKLACALLPNVQLLEYNLSVAISAVHAARIGL